MCKEQGNKTNGPSPPNTALSVVVIGCGPGGMSLMHALKMKQLQCDPNSLEYKSLPNITCYERASAPGGLWKDVPDDDVERRRPENEVIQYEDLWLNNPKELTEYFDYTYDDHFKEPTPAFLPRRDVLEYIVARNNRLGGLEEVHYNHTVLRVSYNDSTGSFNVQVRDDKSGTTETRNFDRCVWAAGFNNKPWIPDEIGDVLDDFEGKFFHSVEATDNFDEDVRGKRIMLIGGSNSAEDLALRAIKHGVSHIYITSRYGEGDAHHMGSYPHGKVTKILGVPIEVVNGRSFKVSQWCLNDEYKTWHVNDIDTVIVCTGYSAGLGMLEDDLKWETRGRLKVSKGWKMKHNMLTEALGDVKPERKLYYNESVPYPALYDCFLISNPKMMYMSTNANPLLTADVNAWRILSYLSGAKPLPKKEEMLKANQDMTDEEMQVPLCRFWSDGEYWEETKLYMETDEGKWLNDPTDERSVELLRQYSTHITKNMARMIKDAGYPLDLGEDKELSQIGLRYTKIFMHSTLCRTTVTQPESGETGLTFRDSFVPDYVSLYTGTPSIPLSRRWLELKVPEKPTCLSTLKNNSKTESLDQRDHVSVSKTCA